MTMWNTVSLRIRGAKTELEDAGLETDGLVESTSKLQAQIKGMTGFDILESDQKTFKSTYDIIVGIGEEYKKLDDVSQASLLELLGGKRQANALASALNNVDDIKNAYQVATDSAGSASKEQSEYEKSIQYSLDKLKASAESFANSFVDSGLVKGIVDLGTIGVSAVDKLTSSFGALPTIITAIAGGLSGFKDIGIFRTIQNDLTGTTKSIGLFGKSWKELKEGFSNFKTNGLSGLFSKSTIDVDAVKSYNEAITNGIDSQTALENATKGTNAETTKLIASANGAKVSEEALADATKSTTIATKDASVGWKALNVAMNVGVMFLITEGISLAVKGLDSLVHSAENAKKATDDFSSSYKSMHEEFNNNTSKISDLKGKYDELSKGVNSLGKNVSLTSDEYTSYKDVISQISEIMPDLAVRYDEQGNKIGFVKGQLEDLNAEYDKYKQKKAIDFVANGDGNGNTLSDAFDNYKKQSDKGIWSTGSSNRESIDMLQVEIKNSGKGLTKTLSTEEIEKKQAEIQKYQDEIDSSVASIQNALSSLSQANSKYYSLTDEQQNYVDTFMSNISDSFIKSNNIDNENAARVFVNKFIDGLKSNKNGVADAYNELFSFDVDTTSMNPDEIKSKVDAMIKKIADALGIKDWKDLKISLGFQFVDDKANSFDSVLNKFKNKTKDGNSKDDNRSKSVQKWADNANVTTKELEDLSKAGYDASSSIDTLSSALDENRKETNSTSNSATTMKSSFQSVWDSLKDTEQNKFLKLANSGKLTAESFNKLGESAESLKKTGLSVSDLCDNIKQVIPLEQKLSNLSTAFKKVSTAYKDFQKNGYVSSNSLNSMPDAFKNLKGYSDFSKTAGNKKSSKKQVQGAFNDITSEYLETYHVLDKVTGETKDKIITTLREAGITNANDLIEQYNRVSKANAKLINNAENNYIKYLNSKGTNSEISNGKLSEMNAGLINALGTQYQTDYKNWLDLLQKKQDAYNEFVEAKNEADSSVYEQTQKGTEGASAYSLYTDVKERSKEYDDASKAEAKQRKKLKLRLKKIDANYSAEYSPTSSSSSSSNKDSSKSSSKQAIDWIARLLDVLQSKIDATKAKFDNLFSLKSKDNNLKKQIKETTALINANKKAASKYNKKAKSVKLSSSLKKKVDSGDYDINSYSESTANKIQKYQDYKDKAKSAKQSANQQRKNRTELRKQRLQLYVDNADAKTSKYNAQIENTSSATEKNKLESDKQKTIATSYNYQIKIAKLEKDSVKVATLRAQKEKEIRDSKIQQLQNLADQAEATANLNQQLETNATSYKDKNLYESRSRDAIKTQYDNLIAIAQLEGNVTEEKRLQAELQGKIAESYKTEFDNIKAWYDMQNTLNESNISLSQSKVAALQAQGKRITDSFYNEQMNETSAERARLIEEKAQLESSLNNLSYGSKEWYDAKNDINSVAQAINNCDENMAEFQKSINELNLAKFELINSQLDSTQKHIEFLVDTLSHKDLFNEDTGSITGEGLATLSLYMDEIQTNTDKITNLRNEWAKFQDQVAKGTTGLNEEDMLAKNEEYAQSIRDAISANDGLKDSIKSLIEEGLNAQKNALDEIIDKYKKALNRAKDLHDYQKNVEDQTDNINRITKSMEALSGKDVSEETRARLQKLTVELKDAEDNLKETEYDKYISDQENMLDDLSSDYEDFISDALSNTDELIENVAKAVSENGDIISNALKSLGYGDGTTTGTRYNSDGSYSSTFSTYDGNGTITYNYDMNGNLVSLTNANGETIPLPTTKTQQSEDSDPQTARQNNPGFQGTTTATPATQATPTTSSTPVAEKSYYDKIVDFLNAKGRQYNKSKDKKRVDKDPVLKHFRDVHPAARFMISDNEKLELGKILGIPSGKYDSAFEDRLLIALNGAGYSTGGLISGGGTGDNLLLRAANKERVLTPQQNKNWETWTSALPDLVDLKDILTKNLAVPKFDYSNLIQSKQASQNVSIGDVNISVDGTNVTDAKSLLDEIERQAPLRHRAQDIVLQQATNGFNYVGR